ncbi:WecB/TagA/CpsF family glycosyltransferase [Rhodococcoides kroppenstedtii]|uniref:WecB/TagA/CpsF family glycosyltransferase n=1 Tax=Rhodococcoides kroppenstedtii TaxID=293050 RepID=UPI001BDE2FA2|nr:WecB/TagA/CpsF family glycosyltransferase [Rhodococcus kroppenstedtii]
MASHLARRDGLTRSRRVTGSDLSPILLRRAARDGLSVAIVGGSHGAGETVRALYESSCSNTILVEPVPRAEFDDPARRERLVARLVAASPHLIFIGLGVPKQEVLALDLCKAGSTSIILCVGAAIDFLAGTHRRAPLLVQRLGLEWAYRILQEPRRLLARYLRAAPFYLILAVKEVFGVKRRGLQR